jgi:hypothetical protein
MARSEVAFYIMFWKRSHELYSFTDAADALREFPRERGYVLIRRALIATLTEDENDLDDALKDASTAADVLRFTDDSETFAAAKSAIGISYAFLNKGTPDETNARIHAQHAHPHGPKNPAGLRRRKAAARDQKERDEKLPAVYNPHREKLGRDRD